MRGVHGKHFYNALDAWELFWHDIVVKGLFAPTCERTTKKPN